MPECVQIGAKEALQNIFLADTKGNARKAYKLFIRRRLEGFEKLGPVYNNAPFANGVSAEVA